MSAIALEIEQTLSSMDAQTASQMERAVRDVLTTFRKGKAKKSAMSANGWPAGYFEATAGAFANEPFDFPDDPPPESESAL